MPTITTSLYTVQRNELVQDECCTPCTPCTPLHLARVIVLKLPRHLQLHLALLNRGLRTHIHTKHTHANMPCEREVVAKRTCHYILHKWSVTDVMTSQLHTFTTSHLHNFTPSQLHNFTTSITRWLRCKLQARVCIQIHIRVQIQSEHK